MRTYVATALTLAALALSAAPAPAARIYAGQPSGASPYQFTMSLSNSGKAVTGFTFHFDVACETEFRSVDFGSALIVDTEPESFRFGEHYMIAPTIKGSKLSATLTGYDSYGDGVIERMNATISGTLKTAKATGRVAVEFMRVDTSTGNVTAQCARNLPWKALRNPGVVYAGKTSQDEPVVVELTASRKQISHSHLGWWAECRSGRWWTEGHDEFDLRPISLSRTGAFTKTYSFGFGPGAGEVERFAGKVSRTKAAGTFQADVTATGENGTDTCTTGRVSWTAATG